LLYLVSNAFEEKAHIPGFRDGVPLLGMEKFLPLVRPVLKGRHEVVLAPDGADQSQSREHGAFDDDAATVASTFRRILGQAAATLGDAPVQFQRSASSLRERRSGIDVRTRSTD
jgi:hypothetical protein